MANLPGMLHDGALLTGIAALLFSIVTATTAMIAVLAPTPARRRAAREVLTVLLRRHAGQPAAIDRRDRN
jgi:hypothetical protein